MRAPPSGSQQRRALGVVMAATLFVGGSAKHQPPVSEATEIVSLTLLPQEIAAGAQASGSIRLDAAAATALRVDVTSSNPAIARVPASASVSAGARSAAFAIQTFADGSGCARISARIGAGAARSDELFVLPRSTPPGSPVSLRFESNTVVASSSVLASVQLAQPAPAGGTAVQLSSGNPAAATVPASIVVPPGALNQRFVVSTSVIASSTCAVITAAVGTSASKALIKIVGITR